MEGQGQSMSGKKEILFISGTRADFGKLKPLMTEVAKSSAFECRVFATGMHALSKYGSTYHEITKSGFKNVFLYMNQTAANSSDMDLVLANTIKGIGYYVREFKPDMVVVHGDRVEALAGAIVGTLNNLLVAHIEGGELSGTIDEILRHSISKLSNIHFVTNMEARNRLVQMGENPDSIKIIGSPDIDIMLSNQLPEISGIKQYYGIDFEDFSIFLYHPVVTELGRLRRNIFAIIDALVDSQMNFLVIYPNNDKGSDIILEALRQLENNPRFRLVPSIRFEYFLSILKNARSIVGNSSAGIHEAPVYGLPTINIGTRQMNRFQHPSIINVPEDKEVLLQTLRNLPEAVTPSLHFGRGDSARLFMENVNDPGLWEISLQKQFIDRK